MTMSDSDENYDCQPDYETFEDLLVDNGVDPEEAARIVREARTAAIALLRERGLFYRENNLALHEDTDWY